MGNEPSKSKSKKGAPAAEPPKPLVLPEKQAPLAGDQAADFAELIKACKSGQLETVKNLLKKPDLALNHFHEMKVPLYYACANGHSAIVNLLLSDKRTNVNGGFVFTPLYGACEYGDLAVVEKLLSYKDIQINLGTKVPLWIASKKGHLPIVQLLIARPELDWNTGSPSAITSAIRAGHGQVAEILMTNTKTPESLDTVKEAISSDLLNIIQLLLENPVMAKSVDDAAFDQLLSTATSCSNDCDKCLEYLLNHKQANPLKASTNDGNTHIANAIRNKKFKCLNLLLGIEGIQLSAKFLQSACDTGSVDIVRAALPFAKESELLALCENEKYRQIIENAQVAIKSARKN